MIEGKKIKAKQLALHEDQHADFLERCRTAARKIAKQRECGTVSINDVRNAVNVPPGVHPSVLGAVFTRKEWRVVGMTTAEHAGAHGRAVRVYVNREAKHGW